MLKELELNEGLTVKTKKSLQDNIDAYTNEIATIEAKYLSDVESTKDLIFGLEDKKYALKAGHEEKYSEMLNKKY